MLFLAFLFFQFASCFFRYSLWNFWISVVHFLTFCCPMKTKLVRFHHHRAGPKISPIAINGCSLRGMLSLECLLRIKTILNFKWNSCNQSLKRWEMVGSLYRSNKHLTIPAILYKSQINLKREHCRHLCAGTAQTSVSSL